MEWRSRRAPSLLVSPSTTKVVIEAFPRSANTFTVRLFQAANPEIPPDQISHHSHSISNVKRAVRWGIPVLVVIRNPVDAIASHMIFLGDTSDTMGGLLATQYVDFYEWIEGNHGGVVLLRFEDVTHGGFGSACRLINQRFGTSFQTGFDEVELARAAREAIMRGSPNRANDSRIPLPSCSRSEIAADLRSRVAANPAVRQAVRLYDHLVATCLDDSARRSS